MANNQPFAEKIFINLNCPPAFQLRQKILGENNANLTYIIQETKANVTLRGRGSGFIEQHGGESLDPLHLFVQHNHLPKLNEAKTLASNLIETIQIELQAFLQENSQVVQIQPQHQQQPIMQTSTQQITIPQAVQTYAVPPPTIIQNNGLQPTHIIQQQNFIPQQIIPHNVPMQIIQNIPPPIRTAAPIVQFQGQPANIQVQGGQQILLNQAPAQQYQLQYIQSPNQITNAPQMHVIQQQPPIQGIIQPNANGQQFITVQGNTSFMIPPPNIIQQNPPQAINPVFNQQPGLAINQDDLKNEAKIKQDTEKSNLSPQQIARIVTNIPLNQPPPVLSCPPPQIFNQQQGQPGQIQQFIVNANPWPQQQQIQQLPLNSQIQIVAQPQTIRSGNEIVIQNPIQAGQQVITTFNPQQGGQQFQQIHFQQAAITQPPPSQQVPTTHQNLSFQQHFEQKVIYSSDIQQQQRAAGKRKFENENEPDSGKNFAKAGVGSIPADRASPKTKNRLMTANQQANPHQGQQQIKMFVNNSTNAGVSGDNVKRGMQNKPMFNKNVNSTITNASSIQKNVTTTVESKPNKIHMKSENEPSVNEPTTITQFTVQPNQQGFMMRPANQTYRFNGPQTFIHQQPPPMSQNSQFNGPRGQIMSNSSMNLYQNVCQSQMMQQPPPATTTSGNQYIQQDAFQQNHNFHQNPQQGGVNRFTMPQQHQHPSGDGHQQQPRFRSQW